jgi:hypothetical protein
MGLILDIDQEKLLDQGSCGDRVVRVITIIDGLSSRIIDGLSPVRRAA